MVSEVFSEIIRFLTAFLKYPIIDTHIHVGDIEEINKAVKKAEYEQYVLLSGSVAPKCVWGNLELLDIKKKAPEKIYTYACFHTTGKGAPEADELLRQVQAYHKVGFDGMKPSSFPILTSMTLRRNCWRRIRI